MFTLKKKIGTPSIKIRNTFKLKKIYIFVILSKIYIFVLLSSKKKKTPKKKFVTEQNNGWQAQHQTHGKPNRLQRKQTHSSQKKKQKKKKKPIQSKLVH